MTVNKDKLIDRVRKLFAMANDASSENEAAIAAKRMRSLMDKYGITLADLEKSDFLKATVANYTRMPYHLNILANAAAKMTDTRSVVAWGRGKQKALNFEGLESDVLVAKLTYEYFCNAMEAGLNKVKNDENGKFKGRKFATSFRAGFANALLQKVKKLMDERVKTSDSTALMVRKDKMIADHFGVVTTSTISPPTGSVDGYWKGKNAGEKVGLNKQVHKTGRSATMIS